MSDASADANASDASSTAEDAPYVLAEETALRGEAEKHFRLSDGTYLAVQYARPVHLQTADGQWADLNNELTLRQGAYQADNGLTSPPRSAPSQQAVSTWSSSPSMRLRLPRS